MTDCLLDLTRMWRPSTLPAACDNSHVFARMGHDSRGGLHRKLERAGGTATFSYSWEGEEPVQLAGGKEHGERLRLCADSGMIKYESVRSRIRDKWLADKVPSSPGRQTEY